MGGKYRLRASRASPAFQGVKPPPAGSGCCARAVLPGLGDDLHILVKRRQKPHQALDGIFAEMALEQAAIA
jgi:hypothetical protein